MKVYAPLLFLITMSAFAAWIDMINVLTYVGYELGKGPFVVGLVAISMLLPHLLFSKVFSSAAKRFTFRQVMAITLLGRIVCSIALVFASDIIFLIAILLIRSFFFGFMQPSLAAYASGLPKDINVASLLNLIVSGSKIIAPAIGGILSITSGEQFAFLVSAGMSVFALASLIGIGDTHEKSRDKKFDKEQLGEYPDLGLSILFGAYFIIPILFIDGLSNFFSNVIPYVFSQYSVPKITLSIALSLSAIGNVLTGLLLVRTRSSKQFPKRELALSWFCSTSLFCMLLFVLPIEPITIWSIPLIFFFLSAVKTFFDVSLTGYIFEQNHVVAAELATLRQAGTALAGITLTLIGTFFMEKIEVSDVLAWVLVLSFSILLAWFLVRSSSNREGCN